MRPALGPPPLALLSDAPPETAWYYGLTWVDWFSVGGVVLTAVGFIVTWIQLNRTRTSREAVADKLGEISARQTNDRLSDLLPILRQILDESAKALQRGRSASLIECFERWNSTCERVIELLAAPRIVRVGFMRRGAQVAGDERTVDLLQSSQSKVAEALRRIDEVADGPELAAATQYARSAMRRCADRADGLMEKQQLKKVS